MTLDLQLLAAGSALTGLIFYGFTGVQWTLWHMLTVPLYTLVFVIFSSLSVIKRFVRTSSKSQSPTKSVPLEQNGITIVYGSVKGNSRVFAQSTYEKLSNESDRQIILQDLNDISDPEEFLQAQVFLRIYSII